MNDGAAAGELADLVGDAPLPPFSLHARARETAEKVTGDADRNPDKRNADEIEQDHPSTLRAHEDSTGRKSIHVVNH
jgi:hypothetical protein